MNQREWQFQATAIKYLRHALPELALVSAIDHATKSAAEGERKKRMGVVRGLPDIAIFLSGMFYGIELKAGRNTASEHQETIGAKLRANGFQWTVARSVEDIETWLRGLGVPLRATTLTVRQYDAPIVRKTRATKPRQPKPRQPKPTQAEIARLFQTYWAPPEK